MIKRILMVVDAASGSVDLDLFAPVYYQFKDGDCRVTAGSVPGGEVKIAAAPTSPEARRFLDAHEDVLQCSVALTRLRSEDFDAILYPDHPVFPSALAEDIANAILLSEAAADRKAIAAIGYGMAGLLSAVDRHGRPLLSEARATTPSVRNADSDPDSMAAMEDKMRQLGCRCEGRCGDEPHVVVDRLLVTGSSSVWNSAVAKALIDLLTGQGTSAVSDQE